MVYIAVYVGWVQRVQIYLTEAQRQRIAERARERGCAQSQVIRELLDRGLGIGTDRPDILEVIADTAGSLADAPDWETWQRAVRGRPVGERLESLGL